MELIKDRGKVRVSTQNMLILGYWKSLLEFCNYNESIEYVKDHWSSFLFNLKYALRYLCVIIFFPIIPFVSVTALYALAKYEEWKLHNNR